MLGLGVEREPVEKKEVHTNIGFIARASYQGANEIETDASGATETR